MSVLLLVPPSIQALNQQGAIERAFHDALFPNLAYRAEAMAEEWPANTGQQIFQSRPGLLTPKTSALAAGSDPQPSQVPYEQWSTTLAQFADAIDTHMPTAVTSNANLFLRNIQTLGLGAGQSINQIARNQLFQAYLSGSTALTAACLTTDTSLQVASLNGFTDVLVPGLTQITPAPVSPTTPLSVTVGVSPTTAVVNVVGFVPSNPSDPNGPGTLNLSAAIGTAFSARASVRSAYAPTIVRSGGGATVDAVGPSDTLLLQDVINAVALLRRANVLPHEDGYYHCHISPIANAQVFADSVFQRLNTALPEGVMYSSGFIGHISGVMFFMNTESPDFSNSGTLTPTGTPSGATGNAVYAQGIGAEVTNDGGTNIGRTIVTGKGALYERYLDESQYVTEAGTVGKIGEFQVVNNGIEILTERIRLVIRAPFDRLQQVVSAAWSITTAFPVPSDITASSGPQRFKRAVVIESST
jgi:hypothetical protein